MDFQEAAFKSKVQGAIDQLKKVLEEERRPVLAEETHHEYADKFGLADFLSNTSIAAQFNCLEALGVDEAKLRTLHELAREGTVTLRLTAEETCSFVRSEKRELDSGSKHVTTGVLGKKESKVVTVLTEHVWLRGVKYELSAATRARA